MKNEMATGNEEWQQKQYLDLTPEEQILSRRAWAARYLPQLSVEEVDAMDEMTFRAKLGEVGERLKGK